MYIIKIQRNYPHISHEKVSRVYNKNRNFFYKNLLPDKDETVDLSNLYNIYNDHGLKI
jgi:hypothetical protein